MRRLYVHADIPEVRAIDGVVAHDNIVFCCAVRVFIHKRQSASIPTVLRNGDTAQRWNFTKLRVLTIFYSSLSHVSPRRPSRSILYPFELADFPADTVNRELYITPLLGQK